MTTLLTIRGPTSYIYDVEEFEGLMAAQHDVTEGVVWWWWSRLAVVYALGSAESPQDARGHTSSPSTGIPSKRDMTHHYSFEAFAKLD